MTARRAVVWLLLLTLALVGLTVAAHYIPLPVPATTAPSPVVLPAPDEPTLVAAVPLRPADGVPPAA